MLNIYFKDTALEKPCLAKKKDNPLKFSVNKN